MIKPADFAAIFFEALQYPSFMRTNFYISKQQESGWVKGVFLTGLSEVYHDCKTVIQIHHGAPKAKSAGLSSEQVEVPIADLTKGNETGSFNLEQIEELFLAVRRGWYFDIAEKKYTSIETLSFAEYALGFIRSEFRKEAKKLLTNAMPATKGYLVYSIAQDGPFIDFPKFKHAFRDRLLSSSNTVELRVILKPFHAASIEIVRLYNEKIFKLERTKQEQSENAGPAISRIEFSADTLSHSTWNESEHFNILSPSYYFNQDLAAYAMRIANLLSQELLHKPDVATRSGTVDFNTDFAEGIRALLNSDTDAGLIRNLKSGKRSWLEAPFRDYFSRWFRARKYRTYMESIKDRGRIDLKVVHPEFNEKIVEFKGWWNRDKVAVIHQLYGYLTQFDGDGFIVMVNHNKSAITEKYKAIVTTSNTKYIRNSWEEIPHPGSSFSYFKTLHRLGPDQKEVYHFIINIF